MSDYPRPAPEPAFAGPYLPDRIVSVMRIALAFLSGASYFQAFYRRWSYTAPWVPVYAWAPPLGSSLTSQASGLVHGVFAGVALWYGRGWGFAYAALTCLSVLIHGLLVHPSNMALALDAFLYLPTFLYCGLRLFGSLGPPCGGLELRRIVPKEPSA